MSALPDFSEFDTAPDVSADKTRARVAALGIALPSPDSLNGWQFPCVLPDHDHLAKVHWYAEKGCWRYACVAASMGLNEVRAAQAGRPRITGLEAARWNERLDYEAGLRKPRAVALTVPDDASRAAKAIGHGLELYLGLRDERFSKYEPFVFSHAFRMSYCDVTAEASRRGMDELRARGLIVIVGKRPIPNSQYPANEWRLTGWPPRLAVVS